ncbi:preprotein translocase subunit SecG [Lewinella sp. 4G2]|uniref:preprotein translocase subunit SecG n=1 Tax=Lewinella sp. 4G2 TaxID=1803372 RepID=UPI0007B47F19|nr:preprotein translocase subunit SecG [Lewinella sp. 4G2]OAV43102.1 preprotein translocase subunit SecG [Lewinella sp. 4G2]
MVNLLTILTGVICLLLMLVVLIQNPKGGGIDSTFGGTQANQVIGASRSTDVIEKITWGLAAALFILCIVTALAVGAQGAGAAGGL